MLLISSNLSEFHLEISGKDFILKQPRNKYDKFITCFVFQFDISGNPINEEHLSNIDSILYTLDKSHFEISGNNFNDIHSENK